MSPQEFLASVFSGDMVASVLFQLLHPQGKGSHFALSILAQKSVGRCIPLHSLMVFQVYHYCLCYVKAVCCGEVFNNDLFSISMNLLHTFVPVLV